MSRFLVRMNTRRKSLEYIPVRKNTRLRRVNGGYKVRGGVTHTGYKLVKAPTKNKAFRKAFGIFIRRRS